jgi:type I restriction enzyme S subunit
VTEEGELPEGWRSTPLLELLAEPMANGKSVPDDPRGSPVLRLNALKNGRVDLSERKLGALSAAETRRFNVRKGDFLVARGNGSLSLVGRGGLVEDEPGRVAYPDTLIRVRVKPSDMTAGWLRFVWNSEVVRRQIEAAAHTSAGIHKVSQQDLGSIVLPVPPIAEQERLSEMVEGLLGVLGTARGRLGNAGTVFRRLRQAFLAAACDGRLTDQWRQEHRPRESLDSLLERIGAARAAVRRDGPRAPAPADFDVPHCWPIVSMDALTTAITSGSRAWSRYYRDDGPGTFIMAQNVRPLRFDRTYRLAVAPPANDPERGRTAVLRGDILVTIVGANTGDVCRVDSDLNEHYVCQSVAYMRPVLPDLSPFLELWLNSPAHGRAQYEEWLYGEGRPHLSLDHLRETAVAVPSLEEQREIVRRVEALFALADAIERRVAAASSRAAGRVNGFETATGRIY